MAVNAPIAGADLPRALRTGEGVYDTLLVRREGLHPAWPLHLGRLLADAEQVGLPSPSPAAARALLTALASAAATATELQRLRVDAFAAGPAELRQPAAVTAFALSTSAARDRVRAPARVVVGPPLRNPADPLSGCKRAATASDRVVLAKAVAAGADEVLIRDVDGHISEAVTSALLVIEGPTQLLTPPAASAPLRSTTMALLAAATEGAGWRLVERSLTPAELAAPRAAALLNAVAGARTVASVDGRALPAPPPALIALVRELVDGGPAAQRAVAALASGQGPRWAQAAVRRGEAFAAAYGGGNPAFLGPTRGIA